MKARLPALLAVAAVALLAAACAAWPWAAGYDPVENGRRIYFTGTNWRGERIAYQGGPAFGGMMMGNGGLSCASCHGPDGRGGRHFMHMAVMDAPDIRYAALAGEEHAEAPGGDGHEGAEADPGDGHGEAAYDLEVFRLAVVEGRHPNGEPLSPDMPRWRLSDQDLADLLAFLKTLP